MTIGLQLCRWYCQEIGAWKWVSSDFVFFSSFFTLFLTYSLSKTLIKWMTFNKVLLERVIHMTKQFWVKIGRFDADKYAGNVLKLECYKLVHAVISKCILETFKFHNILGDDSKYCLEATVWVSIQISNF